MLKELGTFIWTNTPGWIKWPFILIVGPNLTVCALIFFILIVPWQRQAIKAYMEPLNVQRDTQIKHMLESQALRDTAIIERLNRLDEHQSLMYTSLLNTRQAQNNSR